MNENGYSSGALLKPEKPWGTGDLKGGSRSPPYIVKCNFLNITTWPGEWKGPHLQSQTSEAQGRLNHSDELGLGSQTWGLEPVSVTSDM